MHIKGVTLPHFKGSGLVCSLVLVLLIMLVVNGYVLGFSLSMDIYICIKKKRVVRLMVTLGALLVVLEHRLTRNTCLGMSSQVTL